MPLLWPKKREPQRSEWNPYETVLSRYKDAADPHALETTLRQLAKDPVEEVRCRVAANPSCPMDLMKTFVGDASKLVRWGVARNVNATAEMLEVLCTDVEIDVRSEVFRHPRATETQKAFALMTGTNPDPEEYPGWHPRHWRNQLQW